MKKLAIVGATGLVGQTVIKVLQEEKLFDRFDIFLIASDKSVGEKIFCNNKQYTLMKLDDNILSIGFDCAIFLTNELLSKFWCPRFAESGTIVIDNSSAFRLDKNIPLIVPEINFNIIKNDNKIISNPNCSTIQLVVVLDKLRKLSKVMKVVVSSYQSVSGAGKEALGDLINGTKICFKMGINDNLIPAIGGLCDNGNYSEENKIIFETKKILEEDLDVFATAVRVPISYCHGESVYVEFAEGIDMNDVIKALSSDYIQISEDLVFPTGCVGSNVTYVFRLRKVAKNAVMFFVLADNLRRGAAYNAVKILERMNRKEF